MPKTATKREVRQEKVSQFFCFPLFHLFYEKIGRENGQDENVAR